MSKKYLFAKNYEKTVKSFVRVNLAGEVGAVKIYNAQIKNLPNNPLLEEMLDSEIKHFEYFRGMSQKLSVPETLFMPIWKILSHAMGHYSSKQSTENAMLCTQAVETVIEKHYVEQITNLENILKYHTKNDDFVIENKNLILDLLENIKVFLQEEIHHKEIGRDNSGMKTIPFTLTKAATKLAIIISEKI